jgi:hypothetical protein
MSWLERNLEALQGWAPLTAAQIAEALVPVGFERVMGTDGTPTYQRIVRGEAAGAGEGAGRVEWLGGTSMPRASAGPMTESLDVGNVNGIGLSLGTGHEWGAFVRRLPSARMLYVYEPEVGYARMALELCDLSEFFRSGKILLLTGPLAPASDQLSEFVASHLGFEPPTVLHPLATIAADRRNALLSAGEAMVRRAVVERQSQVNAMAGRIEEAMRNRQDVEIAFVSTPRYALERPISAALGAAGQVVFVDAHTSAGVGSWLAAIVEHRPCRIVSDFFRAQIGCVPAQAAVETWIPPLVGAAFWERIPAGNTFGPEDRVIVHAAWHARRLIDRGVPENHVQVRPLERQPLRHRNADAQRRRRVALIGDPPLIEAESLGIDLPTHRAVYAAAREMIEEDYLAVHVGQAEDILRRALGRVGVPCEGAEAVDPALREPMLRIVRDVLIPTLPVRRLVEELMEQHVPLRLVGDWPGMNIPAGDSVAMTPFATMGDMRDLWEDVAIVAHLSPTGVVSPLLLHAAADGVTIVSPHHPTDRHGGALATLLTPDVEYAAPMPQQLVGTIKALLKDGVRRGKLLQAAAR